MNEEKSLIKKNDSVFVKINFRIKKFLAKFNKNNDYSKEKQECEICKCNKNIDNTNEHDMETLKQVFDGNLKIQDLDIDTEKRLIEICSNRLKILDKKLDTLDSEITDKKRLLQNLS